MGGPVVDGIWACFSGRTTTPAPRAQSIDGPPGLAVRRERSTHFSEGTLDTVHEMPEHLQTIASLPGQLLLPGRRRGGRATPAEASR